MLKWQQLKQDYGSRKIIVNFWIFCRAEKVVFEHQGL